MKPRINRTPPLPSSSASFWKDDVKFGSENICSMLLILSVSCWNLLRANSHWKSIKLDLVLNTCCCWGLQYSMFISETIIYSAIIDFFFFLQLVEFTFQIFHPKRNLNLLTFCPEGFILCDKRTKCRIYLWMCRTCRRSPERTQSEKNKNKKKLSRYTAKCPRGSYGLCFKLVRKNRLVFSSSLLTNISHWSILKIHIICSVWFNLHGSKFIPFLSYYLPLSFIFIVTRHSICNCYLCYAMKDGVVSKLTLFRLREKKGEPLQILSMSNLYQRDNKPETTGEQCNAAHLL